MQLTKEEVLHLYYEMRKIRRFEETVKKKSGTDIVGPTHLYIGQEAIAVGVCHHLTKQDYVTSTHRGHGHTLAKGARIDRSLAELYGRSTGYCKGKGGSMHLADFSVGMLGANGVVGGGFNIATGAALAIQQRGGKEVAVCFFGDGSSNRGTFHEAVNLAASWKLPVVFVCENNGWASTTRFSESSSIPQLSERAKAYGIVGVTIDGNDVELVQKTAKDLIERARRGEGPTLIEAYTYRLGAHTTSDDPTKYREEAEVELWRPKDPILRFKTYLMEKGVLTEEWDTKTHEELEKEVMSTFESLEGNSDTEIEDIFKYTYDKMTPQLEEQLEEYKSFLKEVQK